MKDPDNWQEYPGWHSRGWYDVVLNDGAQFQRVWGDVNGFHAPGRLIDGSEVSMIRLSENRPPTTPRASLYRRQR